MKGASAWGNMKAAGGVPRQILYPSSGVALDIPNGDNCFYVYSGTNITIPGLNGALRPGRQITLIGYAGTQNVIITDTAYSSTASTKCHLSAAFLFAATSSITFRQNPNGSWSEVARGVIN